MTEEELAAVIAAIRASMQREDEQQERPVISKWKRAARLEAIGVQ